MPTREQIHEYAISYKGLTYDEARDEYFSIWGQYAAPHLVGTRKVTPIEDIIKSMEVFAKECAIYGCD